MTNDIGLESLEFNQGRRSLKLPCFKLNNQEILELLQIDNIAKGTNIHKLERQENKLATNAKIQNALDKIPLIPFQFITSLRTKAIY